MSNQTTIARYLLSRLKQLGADHIFGVPGDYVLGFCNEIMASDVKYVGTTNELHAAQAADGYARIKGIGAMACVYAVGEFTALNGIAGAWAENVPVVIIVGYPASSEFKHQPLLQHTLGDFYLSKNIFKKITAAATVLLEDEAAPTQIDRALRICIQQSKPVYIGVPCDVAARPCNSPSAPLKMIQPTTDQKALVEAVDEAASLLNQAKKPVIVADFEIVRYHLQGEFRELVEKSKYPFATMMMGKTVLDESHPQFIGIYEGRLSREYVQKRIHNADAVLVLGLFYSSLNTGGFTVKFPETTIKATYSTVAIKNHRYDQVYLKDFITSLAKKLNTRDPSTLDIIPGTQGCLHRPSLEMKPTDQKLSLKRIFDRLSSFIPENAIVLADTGQCQFSLAETMLPKGCTFISQIFYGSIGYTLPATLGVLKAAPNRPVILFIGDGSFQQTGTELSTMLREKLTPMIFLLNNDGYLVERCISDGPYNDIQPWKYHQLPTVFGADPKTFCSVNVQTETQLEDVLQCAKSVQGQKLVFVDMHTDRYDCSQSMKAAGEAISKEMHIAGTGKQPGSK